MCLIYTVKQLGCLHECTGSSVYGSSVHSRAKAVIFPLVDTPRNVRGKGEAYRWSNLKNQILRMGHTGYVGGRGRSDLTHSPALLFPIYGRVHS